MNERIKDFYDQVGLDFENFQRVTVTKGDMEKFTELIVAECAEVSKNYAGGSMPLSIALAIKKHFGVKE